MSRWSRNDHQILTKTYLYVTIFVWFRSKISHSFNITVINNKYYYDLVVTNVIYGIGHSTIGQSPNITNYEISLIKPAVRQNILQKYVITKFINSNYILLKFVLQLTLFRKSDANDTPYVYWTSLKWSRATIAQIWCTQNVPIAW